MSTFIFTGKPTYGLTTKDIKVPNGTGFTIYAGVIPFTTQIKTDNAVEIAYFKSNVQIFKAIL